MGRGELWVKAAFAAVLFPSFSVATISAGVETDVNSRYVWRGLVQDENPVIQPSAWGTLGNLTLEFWSNWPVRRETRAPAPDELDFTLEYALAAAGLEVVPAATACWFPAETETPLTGEVSLRLSRPVGAVAVLTEHSLDIGAFPGAYFGKVGVTGERGLLPNLDAAAAVSSSWGSPGFNAAYAGLEHWALNVVEAGVSVSWQFLPSLHVRPHLDVSALIDSRLRAAAARPDNLVIGLAAAWGI